jgi:hypothetical protein
MTGGKKNLDNMTPVQPEPKVPTDAVVQPTVKDTVLLTWDALSFEKKAKDYRWYLIAGVLILAAIGFLVWQKDWFTIVILLIVSAILFWYVRTTKPQKITYKITPLGIFADARLYPFAEIHSFWLVYNEKVKTLYLAFTRKYLPTLVINVGEVDPVTLKNVLLRRIPEQEKRGENLIDKIVRMIGI